MDAEEKIVEIKRKNAFSNHKNIYILKLRIKELEEENKSLKQNYAVAIGTIEDLINNDENYSE